MQQLRNDYSLTFQPLSIARYSFIQLSRLRRREMKENAQTSKRYQRGFEPGLSRLRVRHSTTEPPRSAKQLHVSQYNTLWWNFVKPLKPDQGLDKLPTTQSVWLEHTRRSQVQAWPSFVSSAISIGSVF